MEAIDRKYKIQAVNPVTGKTYSEENALLFSAKDADAGDGSDHPSGSCDPIRMDAVVGVQSVSSPAPATEIRKCWLCDFSHPEPALSTIG